MEKSHPKIGLALSGGGSRAIAFHLGCLRALHDRGILSRVSVLSGVSGGSVIAALYAYSREPFESFERRVEDVLARGMVLGILREALLTLELPRIIASTLATSGAAIFSRIVQLIGWCIGLFASPSESLNRISAAALDAAPRFASFTTAFERHLARSYFGSRQMDTVERPGLSVVINAAELRTETAFRFGSAESGCWRFGRLAEKPRVATAVAASAAFPALLPALDHSLTFVSDGAEKRHRVIITDGGVYDNLGVSCMLPGRSSEYSTNAFPVDFIIACDAGLGPPSGARRPNFLAARMLATLLTIHRRCQSMTQNLLHRMSTNGEIQGFVMPYLGQKDSALPLKPTDLVPREATVDYPTNFNAMSKRNIERISKRGEQLTRCLIETYAPRL